MLLLATCAPLALTPALSQGAREKPERVSYHPARSCTPVAGSGGATLGSVGAILPRQKFGGCYLAHAARLARRDERANLALDTAAQRSQPRCPARELGSEFLTRNANV